MKKFIFLLTLPLFIMYAQGPGSAFHPMTASGAKYIHTTAHILYWENPEGTLYNEIYFSEDSILVAQSDSSVRIVSGYPDSVFDHLVLGDYFTFSDLRKYYWKVIEYDSVGFTDGEIWSFITRFDDIVAAWGFDNSLDWIPVGPAGFANWSIVNSNHAGGTAPELRFSYSPVFNGTSFLMSPDLSLGQKESTLFIQFTYSVDWFANPCGTIGLAVTPDTGQSWITLWQITPEGDIGPEQVNLIFYNLPETYNGTRFGLFYSGNSYNIDYWYIDDLEITTYLTPPRASSFLYTKADSIELKVNLQWTPADAVDPLAGYHIYRKEGLPNDTSQYIIIENVGPNILSYEDYNVELNKAYTYIVEGFSPILGTGFGNESTAYLPPYIPVELSSFSASVSSGFVLLNWLTATETNNNGFDIERRKIDNNNQHSEWVRIGFVSGYGSTTEIHRYSFTDKNVKSGKYQYRLKQINYDGSFEYSKIVEVEVPLPGRFYLSQNYPNPFNPTTIIKYSIPSIETKNFISVQLKVYDILGNEVATLVNEEKPAGEYEVEFNGGKLTSGLYFYRLQAGSFSETKKLILMR